MLEVVPTCFQEVGGEALEGTVEKLERVFEDDVVTPAEDQVFLHRLTDDSHLLIFEERERVHDEMRVIAAEVMEKHWDFDCLSQLQVAPRVRCTTELAGDVVVVAHFAIFLVCGCTEGLVTEVALVCCGIERLSCGIKNFLLLANNNFIHQSLSTSRVRRNQMMQSAPR